MLHFVEINHANVDEIRLYIVHNNCIASKYEILIKVVIGEFGLLSEPLNLIHLK